MTIKELVSQIKENTPPALTLIASENEYLLNKAFQKIREAIAQRENALDVQNFEELPPVSELINACETISLMGDMRYVLIKDAPLFGASAKGQAEYMGYLEEYDGAAVLLLFYLGKLDKRKKLYKSLKKQDCVVELESLKGEALARYLTAFAREQGIAIEAGLIRYLMERTGENGDKCENELLKLKFLGQPITRQIIEETVAPEEEYKVFELTEYLLQKQVDRAFALIDEVMGTEKSPFGLLALTVKKFRELLVARQCKDAGYSPAKIQEQLVSSLKMHPYRAKITAGQAGRFTGDQLRQNIKKLAQFDLELKTGQKEAEGNLQKLMLELYQIV